MNSSKFGAFLILVFLVTSAVVVGTASANPSEYPGFADGLTTAVAVKYISTDEYHYYVRCTTTSFTKSPATNITHIGYNTFSCNSYSTAGNAYWTSPSGSVDYNDWHQTEAHFTYAPGIIGHNRTGVAAGSHDFGQYTGISYNWDPSVSLSQTFYP